MYKSQLRSIRNMKKQDNITPPKVHNSLITEPKDIERLICQMKNSKSIFQLSMTSKRIQINSTPGLER
jgi:hypothetical protein